jgi:hypothetical protein
MFVITRLSSIVDLYVLYTAHYGLVYPFLTNGIAGSGHGCKKYTKKSVYSAKEQLNVQLARE